jgi:cell division protein FtsQ
MKKRIIIISIWVTLIVGLVVLVYVLEKKHNEKKCSKVEIKINYKDDNYFVTVDDIKAMINKKDDSLVGKSLSNINVSEIEKKISASPYILKTEVYSTVEGVIKINAIQRKPIARVINKFNLSYYIDEEGMLMPLSPKYVARVIVANGDITDLYSPFIKLKVDSGKTADTLVKKTAVYKIYMLSKFIDADEFWKAQIGQIYFSESGDIELIPLLGDNRIIFGDISDIKEKFVNLKAFYEKALSEVGWNYYKTINIKFKNQIVCSKK